MSATPPPPPRSLPAPESASPAGEGGQPSRGIRATTDFWQRIAPASEWVGRLDPPFQAGVPVLLGSDAVLELPVRPLVDRPGRALASLIANQASFAVVARLAARMTDLARPCNPDVIVGLPTLGMVFAAPVAQALGHSRWVPLGYSRKFWYDEALGTPVRSMTTPGGGKWIYLDPNQLPLVQGRSVLLVDDAVSTGGTLVQAWDLLERLGANVIGALVAMRQGQAWRATLGPRRVPRLHGVFDSPILERRDGGWWPAEA